jgi:Lectin C-type domain
MQNAIARDSERKACVLACAAALVVASAASAQNPLGPFGPNSVSWPIAAGGSGHIYEPVAVPATITWSDASHAALAAGGHLATITSAAENLFVFGLINSPPFWEPIFNYRGPWLGCHQKSGFPEPDGGWTWATGESFTYTNWLPGQPDNGLCGDTTENCIQFFGPDFGPFPHNASYARWNDRPDDSTGCGSPDEGVWGYVVEYDVELRCPCTPTGLAAENPPPSNVCPPGTFTLCVAHLMNGSARLQVFNLPSAAAYGKVLVSAVPAFPVGSGPIVGLNFDTVLLFPILLSPYAPGDPVSWIVAAPGFSPEQPFFVPAGTMTQFAGQTWDFVALAVLSTGSYVLSNYVQRTWP